MSQTLMILGHPDMQHGSIANRIIVEQFSRKSGGVIRDLGSLYPHFDIQVAAEQKALVEADIVVFQFPFYWYSVPAILKHWFDQVLSYNFAYGPEGTKLHGKSFLLSITIGGAEESYGPNGYNTYPVSQLLYPLQQTANLCGMLYHPPVLSHSMIYIPGVYNVKEEVEERARNHAARLLATLDRMSTSVKR